MTDSPPKHSGVRSLDSQPTPDTLPLDELFDVLANQRRRYVLQCLREYRTPMALADLAAEIATREQKTPIPDFPTEDVEQVYLSLYHSHIPKLVDASIVEYTQERELVSLSTESERVEPFVETSTANE